jgi:hypothetical protein
LNNGFVSEGFEGANTLVAEDCVLGKVNPGDGWDGAGNPASRLAKTDVAYSSIPPIG